MAEIVKNPDVFTVRVQSSREGWIALHANDWRRAIAAGGDPAARAQSEVGRFHRVLAALDAEAWQRLGTTWRERGTLPADSPLAWFVGAALSDAGREVEAAAWPTGTPAPAGVAQRKSLHDAIRAGTADLTTLPADEPLLREVVAGGARELPDPWRLRTHARVDARAAAAPPLDASLFSGDVGVPLLLPEAAPAGVADGDACRAAVRSLDVELDAWRRTASAAANDDGRALLDDLRLPEGARARLLVEGAVAALEAARPHCALALGQLALDHEAPRLIGPVNSPTLFAVVASAQLHVGRPREALDALDVLAADWPEIAGLDETLNTLVVLQGMDRRGDSRE
ncbi:MAG: hypothetical protein EXR71_17315 [Myxococcales bacterium]|nr:hypothetical protein [Myxococcales bacterium]